MHGFARIVVCGTFLTVCSSFAVADSVSVTGNVSFTPSSLTFAPPFATQADSGVFSAFAGGSVNYMLGTVSYIYGLPQTEEAFTITSGNNVLAFYDQVNSPILSYDAGGNLDVTLDETGYYTFNGGTGYAGTFDLSFAGDSPNGSTSNVGFLGTGAFIGAAPIVNLNAPTPDPTANATAITPEPESFLLMGTGFLAVAGLVRRRRRSVS